MKKQLLSTLLLSGVCASFITAQTYSEITGQPFNPGVNPSMEFFDKDNDGDLDVIIAAYNHGISAPETKLYENDGNGAFTQVTGPFIGCQLGDIGVGDIDGDNDQDIILIGKNLNTVTTNVYLNDGSGNYTIKPNTGLQDIRGLLALEDVDGDNDLDLILTGSIVPNYPYNEQTFFYLNDGAGNYTITTSVPLENQLIGIQIYDFDNDGDNDILTGGSYFSQHVRFYENNNNTGFNTHDTVISGAYGKIELINLDNNNSIDIILGGEFPEVYVNDGSAGFTLKTGNAFGQFNDQEFCVEDFNGDGKQDILEIGWASNPYNPVTKLFYNDGSGLFTENTNTGFVGYRNGGAITGDINGNGDLEILLLGSPSSISSQFKLYQLSSNVCTVNIPDANFKAYLVGNNSINTNNNSEIECTEADAYIYNISCANSSISDLTGLEAFTNITSLSCNGNSIDTLDISQHLALTSVFCHNNSMERLILGQNSAITTLYADQNNFTEIALSGLTALQNIRLNQTSLNAIDLTQNTLLEEIEITQTNIDTINFNQNTLLETVHISGNIQHLDLSNNGNLTLLAFNNSNTLHSLNLKNGNNTNLTYLGLASHSNLNCIEVDSPTYSYSNWNNASFSMPNNVSYSTDCATFSSIKNIEGQKTTIYPNPTNGIVNFSSNENISSIEIYSVTGQKLVEFNKIKTIDISSLPKGVYTAKVITGSSNPVIERLIKN